MPCLAVLLVAAGCTDEAKLTRQETVAPTKPAIAQAEELPVPSGAGAAEPSLFAARDSLLLSWLEPVANTDRVALRFSRYRNGAWSTAQSVVERNDLFVNWADFPSVVEDANGVLFTHWLQKSSGGTYSYDVWMATSQDGDRWGTPFVLNRDGKRTEHGFVTLAALPGGGVGATWLDGRMMSEADGHDQDGGDMSLRYATVDAHGLIAEDVQLDARTCECCTTGMAMADAGPVIAYRDRSPEEVRDIAYVTKTSDGWTSPARVRADDWKINACPVNGPQVDAIGNRVIAAWFTAAQEKGRVFAAFSADGGRTFGTAVQLDEGKPMGRVDALLLDGETAFVTWLEQKPTGGELRGRRVRQNGPVEPSFKIADSSTARAAGFARLAKLGPYVYVAWTDQNGSSKTLRIARFRP